MKILHVVAELFHRDGQTDTYMTKLIVAFRNFAKVPEIWYTNHETDISYICLSSVSLKLRRISVLICRLVFVLLLSLSPVLDAELSLVRLVFYSVQ